MANAVTAGPGNAQTLESVLAKGNLEELSTSQRLDYLRAVCESLGLNPLTQPFAYIKLKNGLTLYARREATEQLRRRDHVSTRIVAREVVEGVYVVTAQAQTPDGRTDESIGAVPIEGLKGDDRANALMRAETKAKRRVTLSICGLGFLDESEMDTLPDARVWQEPDERPMPVSAAIPAKQLPSAAAQLERDYTLFVARVQGAGATLPLVCTLLGIEPTPKAVKAELAATSLAILEERFDAVWLEANPPEQPEQGELVAAASGDPVDGRKRR